MFATAKLNLEELIATVVTNDAFLAP